MNNKKVVFLISRLSGGGAEGVCVNLANGLAKKGWLVDLVILNLQDADYNNQLESNVNLKVLNINKARYSFLPLLKFFKNTDIKKVVIFNYELTSIMILVNILLFNKLKIIARNISILSEKKKRLKSFWKRRVFMYINDIFYIKANYIVNQSHSMKFDLQNIYNPEESKLKVINNPVKLQIEKNNEILEKENYILFVGRLEEVKAIHFIINSFYVISQKFPEYRLKLVGKGSLEKELKDLVNKLGIRDSVDFEGFQGNTIEYYQKAKVTVLTSLYEGFPNVLIESITLGTPIVAFDSPGGICEIVEDSINGFLVPYQNQDILSEKIEQSLHENWDQELIKKSAKRFSNDKILKEWENLLESM